MKSGALILTVVVTLALGLAVGVFLIGSGSTKVAAPPDDDAEIIDLRDENERLRDQLDTRKEAVAQETPAENAADESPTGLAAGSPADETPTDGPATAEVPSMEEPAAPAPAGPRFFADQYNGVLKKVDWKTVGTNMSRMSSLIVGIARNLTKGESPVQKDLIEIQKLNMGLITAAVTVQEELPGTGINGSFSSPPFMVNAISSALEAAGHPLTDEQAKSVEIIAKDYADKDGARLAGYDDRTFALLKLCEEAELKHVFFNEVFAHLDAEQLEIVRPPETRNRVRLDLFSDSLIYSGRVGIAWFAKREDLVAEYVKGAGDHFRFTPEQKEAAKPLIQVWVDTIPQQLLDEPVDRLDRDGLVASTRATAWGRQTLPLFETLTTELDLTENQIDMIRGAGYVLVPLRRDADGG